MFVVLVAAVAHFHASKIDLAGFAEFLASVAVHCDIDPLDTYDMD